MTGGEYWFTRATIRRHAPDVAPLMNTLLNAEEEGRRLNTAHRMLWSLMPETMQHASSISAKDEQKAAFLWRSAPDHQGASSWYVLGPRPREDSAFFDVETKPWSLSLAAGNKLAFDITVNATVNRMVDSTKGRAGRQRVDVVMDAIHAAERSVSSRAPRALLRSTLAGEALKTWWEAQGERNGFTTAALNVINYATVQLEGRRTARFGISHITGVLEVNDPDAFTRRVAQGFGRAKAFGCGLLLLRRA